MPYPVKLTIPYKNIRYSFERACARAGLEGVSPHTLGHTFASRLAMAGVDLRTVQELGGWKDIGMVMRYAHLSLGHKAEAVARIALEQCTTEFATLKNDPTAQSA